MKPLLLLALLTLLLSCNKTPDNSIEITTETQLREFAQQVNSGDDFSDKTIILKKNIALTEDWIPIGDSANRFKGIFNGNGKTISGLSVSDAHHAGLFGYVGENGQIKNINIIATKIRGRFAGGLAGVYGSSKQIENISVKSDSIFAINANPPRSYFDDLIYDSSQSIENNSAKENSIVINMNSSKAYFGGLVGYLYSPNNADTLTISNSYASWNKSIGGKSGGLVGSVKSGALVISNSCANGDIFNWGNAGGLVGEYNGDNALIISNSCAIVNISNFSPYMSISGGLVGLVQKQGTLVISNSFSIGNVFSRVHGFFGAISGGLVGAGNVNISNSYAIGNISTYWHSGINNPNTNHVASGGLLGHSLSDTFTISSSYARGNVSAIFIYRAYESELYRSLENVKMYDIYSGGIFGYRYDVDYSKSIIDSTIRIDSTAKIDSITNKILIWSRKDLKNQENFEGWDFKKIWKINHKINDGYPYLHGSEKFIKELKKELSELGSIHGADSSDSRSKEEIMHFVNLYMPVLNNIYKKYLELKPGFSGKIVLKFTIAPQGDIIYIEDISILSSTTGFPEFDETIKNMIYALKWKKIDGGSYTITVPFEFWE